MPPMRPVPSIAIARNDDGKVVLSGSGYVPDLDTKLVVSNQRSGDSNTHKLDVNERGEIEFTWDEDKAGQYSLLVTQDGKDAAGSSYALG